MVRVSGHGNLHPISGSKHLCFCRKAETCCRCGSGRGPRCWNMVQLTKRGSGRSQGHQMGYIRVLYLLLLAYLGSTKGFHLVFQVCCLSSSALFPVMGDALSSTSTHLCCRHYQEPFGQDPAVTANICLPPPKGLTSIITYIYPVR